MLDTSSPNIKQSEVEKDNANAKTMNTNVNTSIPAVNINAKKEAKYSTEELIENSKALTGCSKEAAIGALFNCKEKELTKDKFKELVKEFLGRKVE